MRQITISKMHFDRVFWTAMNAVASDSVDELSTAISIMKKLKSVSNAVPLGADAKPNAVPADRVLNHEEWTFLFEDEELRIIRKKMEAALPKFTGYVAEEIFEILDIIRNAKEPKLVSVVDATPTTLEPPKD